MNLKLKPSRISPVARRANGPSCRGGASSLLRLSRSDSLQLPTAKHLAGWVQRAAAVLGASAPSLSKPAFGVSEYGVGSTG